MSNKILTVVSVLAFIVLILYLLIGFEPIWKVIHKDILTAYSNHLDETKKMIQGHDILVNEIRSIPTGENIEKLIRLQEGYIGRTKQWTDQLMEFKLFIETNHASIRKVGVNPDYARDNVEHILETVRDNDIRFHHSLEILRKRS